jgi:hypothetical protein
MDILMEVVSAYFTIVFTLLAYWAIGAVIRVMRLLSWVVLLLVINGFAESPWFFFWLDSDGM